MKYLRFLLFVIFVTCISAKGLIDLQDNLSGSNVCSKTLHYIIKVTIYKKENYVERVQEWCLNIPPRCSVYKLKNRRVVDKTGYTIRCRKVKECCGKSLYKNFVQHFKFFSL